MNSLLGHIKYQSESCESVHRVGIFQLLCTSSFHDPYCWLNRRSTLSIWTYRLTANLDCCWRQNKAKRRGWGHHSYWVRRDKALGGYTWWILSKNMFWVSFSLLYLSDSLLSVTYNQYTMPAFSNSSQNISTWEQRSVTFGGLPPACDDQRCILSVSSFYIHTLTQYFLWSCRDHMRLCNCLYDLSYTSVSLMNPSRRQAETVQTEIFLRLCLLIHLNTQRYYRLPWLESKCNSLVSTPVTLPPPFIWKELCALLPLLMPADTPRFVGHKVMTFSPLHDTGK